MGPGASLPSGYEYGPFGEPVRASGPMAGQNPFQWSTKYTDGESGLSYYGYRYYNPSTGKWINRDTLEESGGINLSAFLENSAINDIDFLGLARRTGDPGRNWGRGWNLDLFDSRGQDLLSMWLEGKTTSVTYSDGVWGDYMMANDTLGMKLKEKE